VRPPEDTAIGSGVLRGKVALVTGAASGIGRATALVFGREGAAVTLFDLDEAGGREVVGEIERASGRAQLVCGDVTRDQDAGRAVDETIARYGRLDILFNNAGIIRRATLVDTSEEDWDRVMAVNVKGIFLMSRRAIPPMARMGGGVVINTASVWGLVGGARAAVYCASKGAVALLTKAMAIDHGPDNIRVNCICPGDTDTPMLRSEAGMLGDPMDRHMEQAADVPLRRVARPEEIAQAALYLASDASSFVSGAPLIVDGGFVAA
jgi:NAD(P)-dependent dehydrogenase (short-subunit alcohol dehydrogenase family)